ncbi:MAG: indole-3-glycerol-phosphate synthase [Candidatus Lokiarchaeota archaeon]|nr:indole-3-glycerol-phosphate synthase [Candidatus Lokiarchaeota archaeon]
MLSSRPASFKEQVAKRAPGRDEAARPPKRRSLVASVRAARVGGAGIIAELKRASPSHGPFDCEPATIVPRLKAYEAAGVHGISILTEPQRFNGSFDDLACAVVETKTPVLCKDFVVTTGQLELAASLGASAALIIAKARQSLALVGRCLDLGLEPLLEIHDREDLDAIVPVVRQDPGRVIVGINNRDLSIMRVDMSTTAKLVPAARRLLGDEPVIICESGIESPADALSLAKVGVDGFLIGTAFMNTPLDKLETTIKHFVDACRRDG